MTVFNLNNKTAVITGGGSGIGRAIALCFAAQGATVCVFDINKDAAGETISTMRGQEGKAEAIVCNVANQQEVDEAFRKIISKYGNVDILVNSAGIAHIATVETTTESDFDRIYQVNVKGTYNTMHAVIPHMRQKKSGVILNLASVASQVGVAERFSYSMSKGAIVGMTLSVAKDYVREGIRCNCISPARVHTPFVDGFIKANYPGQEKEVFEKLSRTQPIGRMAKPEEISYLALYLCSDEASFITGCDYPIDGGFVRLNS